MAERTNAPIMACKNLEAELVLLHYGDLVGAERDKLAAHATDCPGCTGYLKVLATLLPLTVKSDQPPQEFWMNYHRELRHKIDAAVERNSWWPGVAKIFQRRFIPALAASAVVVLALTFTLGRGLLSNKNNLPEDELSEALPVAENLDFFNAMDVLDELDLLEFIGSEGNNAA